MPNWKLLTAFLVSFVLIFVTANLDRDDYETNERDTENLVEGDSQDFPPVNDGTKTDSRDVDEIEPETLVLFYNKTVGFYLNGTYQGFGLSLELEKSEISNGTNLCLDVDLDELCDLFYELSSEEVASYDALTLVGEPDNYHQHVRPDLVETYASRVGTNNDSDFSVAFDVWVWLNDHFSYRDDEINFGIGDYWSLPNETLIKRGGDCEDWTGVFLSLVENIRPATKCYGVYAGAYPAGHTHAGQYRFLSKPACNSQRR